MHSRICVLLVSQACWVPVLSILSAGSTCTMNFQAICTKADSHILEATKKPFSPSSTPSIMINNCKHIKVAKLHPPIYSPSISNEEEKNLLSRETCLILDQPPQHVPRIAESKRCRDRKNGVSRTYMYILVYFTGLKFQQISAPRRTSSPPASCIPLIVARLRSVGTKFILIRLKL